MAKSVPKIQFEFGIKNDEFNRSLKEMNNNLKVAKNEIDTASNTVKQFGKNSETLSKQYTAISKALNEANSKVDLYEKKINKTTDTLNKNKESLSKLGVEKEKLTKKYQEAVNVYGKESDEAKKLKEELDQLNKEYKKGETAIDRNQKSIDKHNVALSGAKKEVSALGLQLNECNKAIEENANSFLNAQKKLEGAGNTMLAVGDGINDVSNKLLGISTPIALAGVGISKLSLDFEDSIAKVSTLLDGGTTDINNYKNAIVDLSNRTGKDVNELSEALYQALSAGVDASESMLFLEESNKLASAGFTSNAQATDLLTTALNAYDLQVSETARVSDILMEVQNKGKTTIDELSSSMGKIIPTANANSVSLEQLGASYALMTANGIATAETTTYLNSMLNEMGKTGTKTDKALRELSGKSFAELMSEGANLSEVLGLLSQYAEDSGVNLTDLFGSAEAGKAVLTLTKNEGKDFNEMLTAMENSLGTTDEAFKKIDETTGNKLRKSLNNLKNSFLDTGDNLAPVVDKISEAIVSVAEAIGDMDEATLSNTIKMAGWGVALGTTGKIVGGTVSTVGNLTTGLSKLCGLLASTSTATTTMGTASTVATGAIGTGGLAGSLGTLSSVALPVAGVIGAIATGFYAVHEANDVLDSSILKTTDNMSLMEKGMASLLGVQKYSKDELINMGLVYKDFSENVSEEFKAKVLESEQALRDFSMYLGEINFDKVLSEEESNGFNEKVNNIINGAIKTIESKKGEANKSLKELFMSDSVISETEQKTLDFLNKNYDTNITETNKLKEDIFAIKQSALEEQRGLNEAEIKSIEEKLSEIKRLELESIGGNEEEMTYAKQEFNARMNSIDLESANTLLNEKAKLRDDEIVKIQASYDTQIEMLKGKLSTATDEEKNAIETEIVNLEKSRDDKIGIQQNLYDEYLRILGEKNPEILAQINKFNGELLSEQDKKSQKVLEKLTRQYEGMNRITKDGMYELYDTSSKSWRQVQVDIDERTGEILGAYDTYSGKAGGYTKEIAEQMADLGQEYIVSANRIKAEFEKMGTASINSKDQIVNANGEVITSLSNVTENADGTKEALAEIDGRKFKVYFDENGTISNLESIVNKIDWINRNPASVVVKGGMTQSAWAVGTPYSQEGFATVNERGWELIDTPYNREVVNLSNTLKGDMAYIPEGSKISTHLNSTMQMKSEIRSEVNRVMSSLDLEKNKNKKPTVINVEMGGLNIQGNVTEDILPTVEKMMKKQRDKIIYDLNKALSR